MRRIGMRGINAILITGGILNKSIPIGADIASVSVMTRIFIISTIAARGEVGIKDSMGSVLLYPPLVMGFVLPGPLALASVREPLVLTFIDLQQLVLAIRDPELLVLEPPVLACVPQEPPALASVREPLVQPSMPLEALVLAVLHLGQLLPPFVALVPLEPRLLRSVALEPPVRRFVLLEGLLLPCVLLGLLVRRRSPLEPLALLLLRGVNLEKPNLLRKSLRNSSPTGAHSQIAQPGRSGIILRGKSKFPQFDH
jgi:hypothetical protein